MKVGSDGVQVRTNGVSVETGSNGVSVDMDGVDIETSNDGATVDVDGAVMVEERSDVNRSVGSEFKLRSNSTMEEESRDAVVSTVLVFDASGSMAQKIDGKSRIDLAKEAVANYVNSLEGDVNLSVVAYGHKGDNTPAGKSVSCDGIEEIYYMGPVNGPVATSKVNALTPNGWTPIASSLKKANDILDENDEGGKAHIILLSDGEETCGGDPVAYVKQLCSQGIVVDVIGLDVDGIAQSQLSDIANTCGEYYAVQNATDFSAAVNNIGVKINAGDLHMSVGSDGVQLQTGNIDAQANDSGTSLDVGDVHMDTTGDGPTMDMPGVTVPSF